jgi:hypothetical protein
MDDPRIACNLDLVAPTSLTYSNGDTYKARQALEMPEDAIGHTSFEPATAPPDAATAPPLQGESLGRLRHGRGLHTCSTGDYYGAFVAAPVRSPPAPTKSACSCAGRVREPPRAVFLWRPRASAQTGSGATTCGTALGQDRGCQDCGIRVPGATIRRKATVRQYTPTATSMWASGTSISGACPVK